MPSVSVLPEDKKNRGKTRLLLALLEADKPVEKKQLNGRVVPKKERIKDYQGIFDELQELGAIVKSKQGYSLVFPKGVEILNENLKKIDFTFEGTIVGTWTANALLKWIRDVESKDTSLSNTQNYLSKNDEYSKEFIASYEEFKEITLNIYNKLNRDEKLNNLVPIYQIRRKIGDRVKREYFDSWLLEMQANDIFQLQGGSLPDRDPTKIKDSIETELSGLRCYAILLSS